MKFWAWTTPAALSFSVFCQNKLNPQVKTFDLVAVKDSSITYIVVIRSEIVHLRVEVDST